jgi:hypothetical protein
LSAILCGAAEDGIFERGLDSEIWSYYDDFVMILVTALVRWLASLRELNHTEGIDALLEESSQNANTQMPLHFLYDVGLPYVAVGYEGCSEGNPAVRCARRVYSTTTFACIS